MRPGSAPADGRATRPEPASIPRVWALVAGAALRDRLVALSDQAGFPVEFPKSFDDLQAAVAAVRGLVLIDHALLKAGAERAGLRAPAGTRFIVLADRRTCDDAEQVRLLELGADDVLDPATDLRVLAAKLRAHLRRLPAAPALEAELLSPLKKVRLDGRERRAWFKRGQDWRPAAPLTLTEFQLLALFLSRAGAVLGRRFVLEEVWREDAGNVNQETVDKHVESLRRKLGAAGAFIRTVYGAGYRFQEGP